MSFFDLFRKKEKADTTNRSVSEATSHAADEAANKATDEVANEAEKAAVNQAQAADTGNNPQPETNQSEASEERPASTNPDGKAHIYNLIIIDESGSMGRLRNATLSGVNETINTIRQAQKDFADKQTHYLTLVTFDSPGPRGVPVRTLIDAKPISEVQDFDDYQPCGCTPLFDAMGQSINRLYLMIKDDENATAVVTVMTDGLENASHEYSYHQVKALIEKLKEEGWTFNYMGSAHDVHSVCEMLSIDNVVEFSHDEQGTQETWRRERMSKRRMYERLSQDWDALQGTPAEEKREYHKRHSKGYFDDL